MRNDDDDDARRVKDARAEPGLDRAHALAEERERVARRERDATEAERVAREVAARDGHERACDR